MPSIKGIFVCEEAVHTRDSECVQPHVFWGKALKQSKTVSPVCSQDSLVPFSYSEN